jgi:molybdate transport system substrate-binding protein
LLGVALALLTVASACASGPSVPTIAAASDLTFALTEVAAQFARDDGATVDLVFGSSGVLTRQIRDGAPFEVFLSADEAFVSELAGVGLTRDQGTLYAEGRIVLFAPTGSPLVVTDGFAGLRGVLANGRQRFAIANPEHAPYGRAAEEALRSHGLWDAAQPHLVRGENVSQAALFAASSEAAGGIIAYSIALAPTFQHRGTYALIPASDHTPVRQRVVLLRRSGEVAARFYQYLQAPAARAVFQRHGFVVPETE